MRFEEAYEGWNTGRLTQAEAAQILGMWERGFRRYLSRYEAEGLEGLIDRRLKQVSNHRASVEEVMALTEPYRTRHVGWNVKHFHSWYQREGGGGSSTWAKKRPQEVELVPRAKQRGTHRKRRERSALPGMMIHQDGSTHEWVAGQEWDRIVTLDDATSEHYSMLFAEEDARRAASWTCRMWLPPAVCSAHTTATGAAISGTRRKPAARLTGAISPSSATR